MNQREEDRKFAQITMRLNLPFYQVCLEHSKNVKKLEAEIKAMDLADDDNPIGEKHSEKAWGIKKSAIISVIFAATTLECFIHDYAISNISTKFVNEHLDRLSPMSKWLLYPKLVTNKEINSNSSAFNSYNQLVKLRNQITHYKGVNFQFIPNDSPKESDQYIKDLKQFENKFKKVETLEKEMVSFAKKAPEIVTGMLQELQSIDSREELRQDINELVITV